MALFARTDVEKSFSRTVLIRGADSLRMGQVLSANFSEQGHLCGLVQDADPEPHAVTISLQQRAAFIDLESTCTCPYSLQCKHAAAVALYALRYGLVEGGAPPEISPVQGTLFGTADREQAAKLAFPTVAPVPALIPLSPEIVGWLNDLQTAVSGGRAVNPDAKILVFYVIAVRPHASIGEPPTVTPITRTILKSGGLGVRAEIKNGAINSYQMPKGWTLSDRELILDLNVNAARMDPHRTEFRLDGKHGARLFRDILATGRAIWYERKLQLGPARRGRLSWEQSGKRGAVKPRIDFDGNGLVLPMTPPWYLDADTCECGPLDCGMADELARVFIKVGVIQPEFIEEVRIRLQGLGLEGDCLPASTITPVVRAPNPVPCLTVDFESCRKKADYWTPNPPSAPVAFAKLTFEYEGHRAPVDGSDVRVVEGEQLSILRRNPAAERIARDFLGRCGWDETKYCGWEIPAGRGSSFCIVPPDTSRLLEPLERVTAFSQNVVPKLVEAGWKVDIDENFRFIPDSDVEWDIGLDSGSGIDWFEFQLGIRVEGQPYDLKPILANLFKEFGNAATPTGAVARTQRSDDLFIFGEGGQVIRLSRQRLSAILQPLVEIFGGVPDWPKDFRLPKSLLPEAGAFEDTLGSEGIPWKSNQEIKQLRDKFAAFDHLEPMIEPKGFIGELRGYQREGLAWLQFLREYDFGGILADDMGLGKTVQVLAHLQAEKNAGRLDLPCLIVAPTSTIPNWRRECERFVPDLKVLTLQGAGRSGRFAELKEVDIALTTYPLLARDKGPLLNTTYHTIVLDEAQNVKNHATSAAKAARDLKGRHKLCMSGTPVENHLGELWSLFQFLMPGFLGSDAEFKRRFRTPIEKHEDAESRERLAKRVRPFMLRRTKTQVVSELPPKTEIIERIAFDDPQRDLYESIRISMDAQVRDLIAAQGFDRSRFQILDALLKLRQVCCDPRLVKLPSARAVKVSAKLDRLIEMVHVLLEDGRRILLFSQFTSMLDLIEERLVADGIQWLRISGDTIDRDTPVRRFQAEEVPLFLISLKAGGTGLNLTAADTVILYDPWWNPAVENQAIDRAHRIGQDKAVIVYKLVASGTIEEKMLEMQARKGDIARSILTDDGEGIRSLTADDLRWVLAKE